MVTLKAIIHHVSGKTSEIELFLKERLSPRRIEKLVKQSFNNSGLIDKVKSVTIK